MKALKGNKIFSLLLFVSLTITLHAQTPSYSRIRVYLDGKSLKDVAALGIDASEGLVKKGYSLETDLSATEIQSLQQAGFRYDVLIPDVVTYYQQESITQAQNKIGNKLCGAPEYAVPQHFHLGSYAGYFTYQEILNEMDTMAADFPNLITHRAEIDSSKTTDEGRPLYWMKMTGPGFNGPKPQMMYTALHHAREPLSASQLIFYMDYLLEHYNTDPDIRYLLDHVELYFVPCVNPDGYVYNQTTNPNGGGLWRKNRHNNNDGTYGVDINRNYGYKWGLDNIGSSPNTNSETYRGTSAFSEKETQMMRDFDEAHDFKIVLNYHTYGGDIVFPWGYQATPTPDSAFYSKACDLLTSENRAIYGTGDITVGYNTNGDADDWGYGEQITKNKIFSMTPEVGTAFWDAGSAIIPTCKADFLQNIEAARMLLPRAVVNDNNPVILPNSNGQLYFDITRLGLPDSVDYTVSFTSLNTGLQISPASKTYSNMALAETRTDSFSYTINTSGQVSNEENYAISVSGGGITYTDTFNRYYGGFTLAFDEPCNNLNQWNATGSWGLDSQNAHSGTNGISDSPGGNYNDNVTSNITTKNYIDLTTATKAFLTFYGKWDIETSYDYVEVEASTNGNSWTPLCGQYTHAGGSYQDDNQPVFDAHYLNWVPETIDLTDYLGQQIKLRFHFVSDQGVNFDGFAFDDLKVWVMDTTNHQQPNCQGFVATIDTPATSMLTAGTTTIDLHSPYITGAHYQWQMDGQDIANANDTVYTVTQPGNYNVVLTNDSGCQSMSDTIFITGILGLSSVQGTPLSITVSPNPFDNSLNVVFASQQADQATISIKDLLGRELFTRKTNINPGNNTYNLDLSSISAKGIYLLSIQTQNGLAVKQIIKQ